MKALILSGPNHGFAAAVPALVEALSAGAGLQVAVTEDRNAYREPGACDVFVLGTGFTRGERQADGSVARVSEFTPEQEVALQDWVAGGGGLVGLHGTGWWIGGRAYDLIGGHANWHPPGLRFPVDISDSKHAITRGLASFEVDDEIYMCAHEPDLHILASTEWQGRRHPLAWVRELGQGRVFYTTLGHSGATFAQPGMAELLRRATRWAGKGDE